MSAVEQWKRLVVEEWWRTRQWQRLVTITLIVEIAFEKWMKKHPESSDKLGKLVKFGITEFTSQSVNKLLLCNILRVCGVPSNRVHVGARKLIEEMQNRKTSDDWCKVWKRITADLVWKRLRWRCLLNILLARSLRTNRWLWTAANFYQSFAKPYLGETSVDYTRHETMKLRVGKKMAKVWNDLLANRIERVFGCDSDNCSETSSGTQDTEHEDTENQFYADQIASTSEQNQSTNIPSGQTSSDASNVYGPTGGSLLTIVHPTRADLVSLGEPVQKEECCATEAQWKSWVTEHYKYVRTNATGGYERCKKSGFRISSEFFDGREWSSVLAEGLDERPPCMDWTDTGFCRRGYDCKFRHD